MSNLIDAAVRAAKGTPIEPMVREALDRISAARTTLMLDAPFYGGIALKLELVHAPAIAQGTAATDGRRLYFNAEWINQQSHKQLVGLLAHEVMHVAMEHTLRREGRNRRDWNVACDHAINNDLYDSGFALPEDGFRDTDYRGWCAEEVYRQIARPELPLPPEVVCGYPGAPGGGDDGEGESDGDGEGDEEESESQSQRDDDAPPEEEKLPAGGVLDSPDPVADKAEIQVMVMEAAMLAKAAGNLPGNLQKLINELTQPKMDFREIMAEYLTAACVSDYTFRSPNRRYLSAGVYLPSLQSEDECPELAFLMDTSGSRYSDDQLQQTVSVFDACCQQLQPERVHAMACDTEVQWKRTFERGEKLEVQTPGGGGTYLQPMFDELKADGVTPACAVVITDGYVGSWPEDPGYPVLWIITSPHVTAPFGRTVHINERSEVIP